MGKKYIIELLDDCPSEFKGIIVFGLTPEGQISAEPIPVEDLTPYTEPNLERVRKKAYQKGYETGYEDGYNEPGKNQQEAYQRGLNDAWEAARTLWNTPNRKAIFGYTTFSVTLTTLTAQEVIEKIRQYEQENAKIQVGDEVNAPFGKAIVVNINSVAEKIWLVYADGHGGFEYFKDAPTKTGRHFPEIAEVLRKMRENNG